MCHLSSISELLTTSEKCVLSFFEAFILFIIRPHKNNIAGESQLLLKLQMGLEGSLSSFFPRWEHSWFSAKLMKKRQAD